MKNQNSNASGVKTTDLAQIPVNANTAAQLTVLSSQSPKVLTKQILLDDEGNMVKIPSAHLTRGNAEVVEIQSMQEFSELLQGLEDSQALVYGVPKGSLSQAKVVTKKAFSTLSDTKDVITRSNDHFEWPSTAGIMMFDYDPDDTVLDQEAVLNVLYTACPAIKDVDHLWWTSSSSNIVNNETKEQLSYITGQRVYLMVDDASDIPRAAKVIADRLWLHDHGNFKISSSGSMLERVPFDMSVYQPSRLDFAAGASTKPPLAQIRGVPALTKGTHCVLDTKSTLPDLDTADQRLVEVNKLGRKTISMTKAAEIKEQFITNQTARIVNKTPSLKADIVSEEVRTALTSGTLPSHWPLHVWVGNSIVEMTVEEVLVNKFTFHESLCLDPIEPNYDDGRVVGKLYLDQRSPCLHTFARGEYTYKLLDRNYEIELNAVLSTATDITLEILKQRQEVFNYGGTLVMPINSKLNYIDKVLMKHSLSSLIKYLKKDKPCDPTNDLVDGVLRMGIIENINPVKGYVDHPIIDAKLRLFSKQGYEENMQMLGRFDHSQFDVVDRKLLDDEVTFHLGRIYAPFTEFKLAGVDDKSILMAAIFSGVLRQVLPTCPAFGFDAPMPGSGKTLLAETIAIIAAGEKPSALAPGRADYDEEFRKRLFALLLKGEKVCLFDNIVGEFDSPSFAAALTSEYYEDRILQHSRTSKIFVRTLFLITGNNLRFTGDMTRRVLKVRLKPDDDKLALREFQFDPIVKAMAMRKQIISSVLSLINHWKHCDAPKAAGTMTSFSEWDLLVRQPLALIGQQQPKNQLLDLLGVFTNQQANSSDKEALIALLTAIAVYFGEGGRFKARDIHDAYQSNSRGHLTDAVLAFISKEKLQSSQHLGAMLKQFKDKNVEGLVLRGKITSGSFTFWIELTDDTHRHAIEYLSARQHESSASNDPSFAA